MALQVEACCTSRTGKVGLQAQLHMCSYGRRTVNGIASLPQDSPTLGMGSDVHLTMR